MNVILVIHDSVFSRFLATGLHDAGKLDQIILETGRPSWRFYRTKLLRVGPINGAFQWWLNRWFKREGARSLPNCPLPPHETMANVNRYDFGDEDLVIGFGSSYITASTLQRMKHGFLNLHTGILPDYRGVKSEFWTLYQADHNRAGWTLHYMTPKLDEGDIVLQHFTEVRGENPAQLRAKLLREAVPALGEFVDYVRASGWGAIPRRPQEEGRYFTTPTWREWRAYRRAQRSR